MRFSQLPASCAAPPGGDYGSEFQGIPTVFWLPQEVRVYVALGNLLLSNRHRYSDYHLFRAEAVIKPDTGMTPHVDARHGRQKESDKDFRCCVAYVR